MASAPKDGTLVLVAIRESEQGPAQVDVARWTKPARANEKCWVSAEFGARRADHLCRRRARLLDAAADERSAPELGRRGEVTVAASSRRDRRIGDLTTSSALDRAPPGAHPASARRTNLQHRAAQRCCAPGGARSKASARIEANLCRRSRSAQPELLDRSRWRSAPDKNRRALLDKSFRRLAMIFGAPSFDLPHCLGI